MGRYKTEHTLVDVSPLPLIPVLAKKATITDTKTKQKAEGYDWKSFGKAEAKAREKLSEQRSR